MDKPFIIACRRSAPFKKVGSDTIFSRPLPWNHFLAWKNSGLAAIGRERHSPPSFTVESPKISLPTRRCPHLSRLTMLGQAYITHLASPAHTEHAGKTPASTHCRSTPERHARASRHSRQRGTTIFSPTCNANRNSENSGRGPCSHELFHPRRSLWGWRCSSLHCSLYFHCAILILPDELAARASHDMRRDRRETIYENKMKIFFTLS